MEALQYAEREVYTKAHAYANGNQTRVASLIGVSRGTAIYKLKQLGLI
jgi:DNA-binding protein Fis